MKHWLIITNIIFFYYQSYGQDNSKPFFLNEYCVSINRTVLKDENTEDRVGFGIGVYHTWMQEKKLNVVLGLEFNNTSQNKKKMYEGHFAHSTDLTYYINNLSLPSGVRLNSGNKVKVFVEAGLFVDFIISSKRKGIMHSYFPDQNNNIVYKEFTIDEKANLSSLNYGMYFSIGVKIPVYKNNLIIKSDYKMGLNTLQSNIDNIYNKYLRLSIGLEKVH
jgi:hypothetical protein